MDLPNTDLLRHLPASLVPPTEHQRTAMAHRRDERLRVLGALLLSFRQRARLAGGLLRRRSASALNEPGREWTWK